MAVPDILEAAHLFVSHAVQPGDTVVDATVGNGHDTEFLADEVGDAGRVYGFDIQAIALERTRDRLRTANNLAQVELIHAGHEKMDTHLPEEDCGRVGAAMFNLGYLPGHGAGPTTTPATTLAALPQAVEVIRPGGIITVVLYTGHAGGEEEAEAVQNWGVEQPQTALQVLSYNFINRQNDPPRLLVIEKKSSGSGAAPAA
ncbi:MAG: class I SAM-dependent methyltransferase [Salinibacter sp.]